MNLVVILRVSEGKRKHTLLLQVGLVDTGKRPGDNSKSTQVSRLKSSVFARRALSVVPVTDNNPRDVLGLVISGSGWDSIPLTGGVVLDLVGLAVGRVDGTDKHVVGDVVKMSTVLEPRAGHGDVVSGGLAVALDKNWEVLSILSVPGLERLEELETVAGWRDGNADAATLSRWCLVGVLSWVEASAGWKPVSGRRLEEELLAIRTDKLVGERVEVKASGDGHGDDEIGGSDEGVGSGVGIVTSSEVTVVGREDRVSLTLLDVLAVPLANAGSAGVGKNHAAELLQSGKLSITLDGSADLLGTGGDGEQSLGLDAVVESVASDRGRARHILVGRVGAGTDQSNLKLLGPVVGLDSLAELGDGGGQIWGEWAVDVGLELRQVDLDELIVLGTLILPQLLCVSTGEVSDVLALGDGKVVVHAVVEGEQRGGGTNLGTHVTDGGHTGTRDTVNARAVVFDNSASSTLDGQNSSNLKNDVYVATYISDCSQKQRVHTN